MAEVEETPAEDSNSKGQKKGGLKTTLMLVFGSIGLIVAIKHSFIYLMIGMMPSVIAYLIDPNPQKVRYRIIRNLNLAGLLPSLIGLILQGNTAPAVHSALSQTQNWMMMYGGAGLGFLMVWLAPAITHVYMDLSAAGHIRRMEGAKQSLIDEWGDVTGQSPEGSGT